MIGNRKAVFIFDGTYARRMKNGKRARGQTWMTFNDIGVHFLNRARWDGDARVTIQKSPRGQYHVIEQWTGSYTLDVMRRGVRVGRVCREVVELLFGPVGDGLRFNATVKAA